MFTFEPTESEWSENDKRDFIELMLTGQITNLGRDVTQISTLASSAVTKLGHKKARPVNKLALLVSGQFCCKHCKDEFFTTKKELYEHQQICLEVQERKQQVKKQAIYRVRQFEEVSNRANILARAKKAGYINAIDVYSRQINYTKREAAVDLQKMAKEGLLEPQLEHVPIRYIITEAGEKQLSVYRNLPHDPIRQEAYDLAARVSQDSDASS